MKKTFVNFLMAGAILLASCGNNADDSKKEATQENKEKFDSTGIVNDTKFAVAAADGGMLEVELGKLAQTNGSSKEVKNLGQLMIDDHSKAGDELKNLSTAKNISLPQTLSNKSQGTYDGLAKKKGLEFDKAYASLMVDDHKEDIDEFTKESEKGTDAELTNWATAKLPVLQHHLMMARAADSLMKKK